MTENLPDRSPAGTRVTDTQILDTAVGEFTFAGSRYTRMGSNDNRIVEYIVSEIEDRQGNTYPLHPLGYAWREICPGVEARGEDRLAADRSIFVRVQRHACPVYVVTDCSDEYWVDDPSEDERAFNRSSFRQSAVRIVAGGPAETT